MNFKQVTGKSAALFVDKIIPKENIKVKNEHSFDLRNMKNSG